MLAKCRLSLAICLTVGVVGLVTGKVPPSGYTVNFVTLRNKARVTGIREYPVGVPQEYASDLDIGVPRLLREYPSEATHYSSRRAKFGRSSPSALLRMATSQYKLRYSPKPRLFWHKFPVKQTEPTTTPEPPEPMPTDPPEEPTPPPTEEVPPPTMTTTTSTTTTRRPPLPTYRPPSTTMTTIMRPPFVHKFGSTLKNLLGLFGSPGQANLLVKHPYAPKTKGNASSVSHSVSKGKGFLSIFEVIKFPNTQCFITMGDIRSMEGICYHEFECKSLGGIPTQRCADGVGVCCIFLAGCGDSTNQQVTYFESPNYPNPVREVMICVLVVNLRDHVQQLRLDFLMFELNRPTDGDCIEDQFIVSGQNMNFEVPILCGINTGQHVYIHVDNSAERKIYLTFLAKIANGGRSFNIKITQIKSDNVAPEGCLQFYKEPEGVLKSFNYDIDGSVVENRQATYLNNLNYAICVQRSKEACSMRYNTDSRGGDQLDFQIVNKDEAENDLVPDGQAGAGIFNCPDDYVAINQVRLCGDRLNDGTEIEDFSQNAPVRDMSAGPIVLPVRSDNVYVGRGFRLLYKQEACLQSIATDLQAKVLQ